MKKRLSEKSVKVKNIRQKGPFSRRKCILSNIYSSILIFRTVSW